MPSIPAILLGPFLLGRYPNSLQKPITFLKRFVSISYAAIPNTNLPLKYFGMHLRVLQLIHTYSVRVLNETAVLNSNLVGEKDVK